jgi:hypothetical protein
MEWQKRFRPLPHFSAAAPGRHQSLISLTAALAAMFLASNAWAATIVVGDDQPIKTPSAAAAIAKDGDTVEIEPHQGGYFDCAIWKQNNLTIEGKGPDVVITDKSCQGKALFVIDGDNVTIRNLTLQRARVPDGNGAGIRAEGGDLHVDNTHFINNQNGILAASNPKAKITITNSEFVDNGVCNPVCSHGIYVDVIALLHIENSVFKQQKEGHHIKSRALRTELIHDDIEDGPTGTASYLVDIPNGGAFVMRDSTLEKGPKCENHSTAVSIGEEGIDRPTPEIIVANNKFTNDLPMKTIFVRNGTATEAQLTGNTFVGDINPLSGDGSSK